MPFRKAQRRQARLRLALCGPSGSGKTYSALVLAKGLGGPVAMIDTERGSGELYADDADLALEYDVCPLAPPFSPDAYIRAIGEAEKAGYAVLIIDSLSHAWVGEGGILDIQDRIAKANPRANSFATWRDVTPQHNRLVDAILAAGLHVIVTMRTKTAWEVVENEKGKKAPVKIGLAPVQRDGMEYEFTTVLDIGVEGHIATASKDRTKLFTGVPGVLTVAHGQRLRAWLESAAPEAAPAPAADPPPAPRQDRPRISKAQHARLEARIVELSLDREWVRDWFRLHGAPEPVHLDTVPADLYDALDPLIQGWAEVESVIAAAGKDRAAGLAWISKATKGEVQHLADMRDLHVAKLLEKLAVRPAKAQAEPAAEAATAK